MRYITAAFWGLAGDRTEGDGRWTRCASSQRQTIHTQTFYLISQTMILPICSSS